MEENSVSLTAGGEWEIDAAEIMQGVVDEAEPGLAQKPEPEREPESYTLRHLGEERSVGRDELIALAQKGLDYDRIRGKLGDASRQIESLRSGGTGELSPEERRRRDCESFVKSFPEAASRLRRDRGAIPEEVWEEVRRGREPDGRLCRAPLPPRGRGKGHGARAPALRARARAPRARERPPQRGQRRLRRRRPALRPHQGGLELHLRARRGRCGLRKVQRLPCARGAAAAGG